MPKSNLDSTKLQPISDNPNNSGGLLAKIKYFGLINFVRMMLRDGYINISCPTLKEQKLGISHVDEDSSAITHVYLKPPSFDDDTNPEIMPPPSNIEGMFVIVSEPYTTDDGIHKIDVFSYTNKQFICTLFVQNGYRVDWELYKYDNEISIDNYRLSIDEAIEIANENFPGITNGEDISDCGNKVQISYPYVIDNLVCRENSHTDAVINNVKLIDVYDKENNLIGRLYRYSNNEWKVFNNFTSKISADEVGEYIDEAISLANIYYIDVDIARNSFYIRCRNKIRELLLNKRI